MSATIPPAPLDGSPLARAAGGLDACVHCGFCLQACPTYLALEDENDSPRGRLVLMRGLLEGTISPDDEAVATHFDRCLGCRGCESACPSGVPYGTLIEATRATLSARRPRPFVAQLMLRVFGTPWMLRAALAVARLVRDTGLARLLARLPEPLAFPFAMLNVTRSPLATTPYRMPDALPGATHVDMLDGCVMHGLFDETNAATERVLRRNGYAVSHAPAQGCCGALHAHAGDVKGARALARRNIAAFEASGAEYIAVNAAGCGAMMKEYGHLFADDPAWHERAQRLAARVRDVSELLSARGPVPGGPLPLRLTADQPCHLQHAQHLTAPPAAVLAAIPGLDLRPLADSDQCCGSAGIYNLLEPETSTAVLRPKLQQIAATGANLVATGNPGCLMQIGAGLHLAGIACKAVHPVVLLDASYAVEANSGKHAH